jgi:DNA-binding protein H-NS
MKQGISILVLALLIALPSSAQKERKSSQRKQQKEAVNKEAGHREEISASYADGVDRHRKIQDKSTKKRMKQQNKARKRQAKGREVPFYQRWFRKGHF